MKLFFAILIIASLTTMAASAQQTQAPASTCSGFKDRCEQHCVGLRAKGRCGMDCEAKFNLCMQSGTWRGLKSNARRIRGSSIADANDNHRER
jgi:hypothetical protein